MELHRALQVRYDEINSEINQNNAEGNSNSVSDDNAATTTNQTENASQDESSQLNVGESDKTK